MLMTCTKCNGKKFIPVKGMDYSITCPYCKMTGQIDVPDDKKLCPDCLGRAKVVVRTMPGIAVLAGCGTCNATGFISDN